MTNTLNPFAEAMLDLGLLNARARRFDPLDAVADLLNRGLAPEIVFRLRQFAERLAWVDGELVEVGRIVLMEVWAFVKANPRMVIGMAVGAALGALAYMIPLIGPWITSTAMLTGAALGGIAGYQLDLWQRGVPVSEGALGTLQAAIYLAEEFFKMLARIFNAVRARWSE